MLNIEKHPLQGGIAIFAITALLGANISGLSTDQIVHAGIVAISVFLLSISTVSYRRQGRKKLLFVWTAFLIFTLREAILLVNAFISGEDIMLPILGTEFSHFLGLWIVVFFALGILER